MNKTSHSIVITKDAEKFYQWISATGERKSEIMKTVDWWWIFLKSTLVVSYSTIGWHGEDENNEQLCIRWSQQAKIESSPLSASFSSNTAY